MKKIISVVSMSVLVLISMGFWIITSQAVAEDYAIMNGSIVQGIFPLSKAESATDFYTYNNPFSASGDPDFGTVSSVGFIWLYENSITGDISLGVIFDKPLDGSGGTVDMPISGVPSSGFIEVADDPNPPFSDIFDVTQGQWAWGKCCTDGGMIGGLNGPWEITLSLNNSTGINEWYFLSGPSPGSPSWVRLNMSDNLIITAKESAPILKWRQPPDMELGVNVRSIEPEPVVADDWRCLDPRPVTDVHFWGSYIGWERDKPDISLPTPGVTAFVIRIYEDIPQGVDPDHLYSHPGEMLYEATIENFVEEYVKSILHPDGNYEHKFVYSLDLPKPFEQVEGTVYWISISAVMPEESKYPWGWETSITHWNDNACRYWFHNAYWEEITPSLLPPWYQDKYKTVDMAFELTVSEPAPPPPPLAFKWQQRPDMKHGANIISTPDIDPPSLLSVADDWLCLTGSPVTDLHFWGSYPGFKEKEPGPVEPPHGVYTFRIRIYSDAPASAANNFSRPDRLLYEAWVPYPHFTETYVASILHPQATYEHKFRYDLELPRTFWQRRGRVYWISIAARLIGDFPHRWGWENSTDRWNDYAVKGWYKDPDNWNWDVLKSSAFTVDFNDLTVGASYPVGSTFLSYGIPVGVLPFQYSGGGWTSGGTALVDNLTRAGGSVYEINTGNVNLGFGLPYPVTDVSFLFGEYGGNVNLRVNGELKNFENYNEINGATIGGVGVTVANGNGNDAGRVNLAGMVTSLAMGGQEHFVDDVSFSRFLDMSFELTSCKGPLKWLQFPDMVDGRNIISSADTSVVADDFLCTNGKPVTKVHFWGSYLSGESHWAEENPGPPYDVLPELPPVEGFKFSFHEDVPAGSDPRVPYSHPGELIQEVSVGPEDFTVRYWDSIPHTDVTGRTWWEHKFYYVAKLPKAFRQTRGDIYWLDIGAVMPAGSNYAWGWETSKDHWNDRAVRWVGDTWGKLGGTAHVDFEDLTIGTSYPVGASFTSGGISFDVEPFQWNNGDWTSDGYAEVMNPGNAGGSGKDVFTNNVNLHATLDCPTTLVSFRYADAGGNINMGINGDFRNTGDLIDLDGMLVGGVEVTVTAGTDNKGIVTLRGEVRDLLVGGQEFSIDDIDIACRSEDMAFALVTEDDTKYCRGDFLRDGDVDGTDLAILAEDFDRTDCYDAGDCEGDFIYDGDVDKDDLKVFAAEYGRDDCPCMIPEIALQ